MVNNIDKSTFNRLSIGDQIKIFNSLLLKHDNIKNVCSHIGISYSTIRDRFHKNKYKFDKVNKKYIHSSDYIESEELEIIIRNILSNMNTNTIETKILNDNIKDSDDKKLTIRSFRIYENVLSEFIEFSNNTALKQYDVLSLFILEGLNKYKKTC